jgi:hypothetical protein
MSTKIHPKCPREFTQKMPTKIHPKKGLLVDKSVHEMSHLLSTRSHLLCPRDVCHPFWHISLADYLAQVIYAKNCPTTFYPYLLYLLSSRDHSFKTSANLHNFFDPRPPTVGSFLLPSVGKFGQVLTPPP